MTGFFSLEFWALVLAVAVDVVFSIVADGAAWMSAHQSSRERYAEQSRVEQAASDHTMAPVADCQLCGPTPLSLGTDGLCWKCAPIVAAVRKAYAT